MEQHPSITEKIQTALRLVWRIASGWTAASAGLVVVQGVLPLARLYLMKRIVSAGGRQQQSAPTAAAECAVPS